MTAGSLHHVNRGMCKSLFARATTEPLVNVHIAIYFRKKNPQGVATKIMLSDTMEKCMDMERHMQEWVLRLKLKLKDAFISRLSSVFFKLKILKDYIHENDV